MRKKAAPPASRSVGGGTTTVTTFRVAVVAALLLLAPALLSAQRANLRPRHHPACQFRVGPCTEADGFRMAAGDRRSRPPAGPRHDRRRVDDHPADAHEQSPGGGADAPGAD